MDVWVRELTYHIILRFIGSYYGKALKDEALGIALPDYPAFSPLK